MVGCSPERCFAPPESLGQLFRGAEKRFRRAVFWGEQRSVCTFGPSYRADQNGVGYSQKKEQLDFLFLPHKCTPEVRVAEKKTELCIQSIVASERSFWESQCRQNRPRKQGSCFSYFNTCQIQIALVAWSKSWLLICYTSLKLLFSVSCETHRIY